MKTSSAPIPVSEAIAPPLMREDCFWLCGVAPVSTMRYLLRDPGRDRSAHSMLWRRRRFQRIGGSGPIVWVSRRRGYRAAHAGVPRVPAPDAAVDAPARRACPGGRGG